MTFVNRFKLSTEKFYRLTPKPRRPRTAQCLYSLRVLPPQVLPPQVLLLWPMLHQDLLALLYVPSLSISATPESFLGQVVVFVGKDPWHVDLTTGEHWADSSSDARISEAEVEAEVSGGITDMETIETNVDAVAAARALIAAEVGRNSSLSHTSLIVAARNFNPINPYTLRSLLAASPMSHLRKRRDLPLCPYRRSMG